jgi:hypothetical protein
LEKESFFPASGLKNAAREPQFKIQSSRMHEQNGAIMVI